MNPEEPKPELSPMEQAWLRNKNTYETLSPRDAFYVGWIQRGFHQLDQLNRIETEKKE